MNKVKAIILNSKDNVAVMLENVKKGEIVYASGDGKCIEVEAIDNIDFGHKIALNDIKKGEQIIKYGQTIGLATDNIFRGNHVHIHNIESCRARGDKQKAGGINSC